MRLLDEYDIILLSAVAEMFPLMVMGNNPYWMGYLIYTIAMMAPCVFLRLKLSK